MFHLPVSYCPRIEVHRKLYLSYGSVKFGLGKRVK